MSAWGIILIATYLLVLVCAVAACVRNYWKSTEYRGVGLLALTPAFLFPLLSIVFVLFSFDHPSVRPAPAWLAVVPIVVPLTALAALFAFTVNLIIAVLRKDNG
jgi:hypothetical protein